MSGYICKLDEKVERRHVRYNNRYGIADRKSTRLNSSHAT